MSARAPISWQPFRPLLAPEVSMRGWWNTVEMRLFEISNSIKTVPLCFSCKYNTMGSVIVFLEPRNLDEVSNCIPPTSHSRGVLNIFCAMLRGCREDGPLVASPLSQESVAEPGAEARRGAQRSGAERSGAGQGGAGQGRAGQGRPGQARPGIISISISLSLYIYIYICIYIYIYVYVYVYIYIYRYIDI